MLTIWIKLFKNQVIRVTAGADRERERGKPRIRLVANMHGVIDWSFFFGDGDDYGDDKGSLHVPIVQFF